MATSSGSICTFSPWRSASHYFLPFTCRCFPARDGREVHMSYWYDDGMHRTVRKVNIDLSASFHSYVVRWRPEGIDFIIDDTLVHQVRGQAGAMTLAVAPPKCSVCSRSSICVHPLSSLA